MVQLKSFLKRLLRVRKVGWGISVVGLHVMVGCAPGLNENNVLWVDGSRCVSSEVSHKFHAKCPTNFCVPQISCEVSHNPNMTHKFHAKCPTNFHVPQISCDMTHNPSMSHKFQAKCPTNFHVPQISCEMSHNPN